MDLRQLEIVRMVADTGSFTAASRRLHVSQSAVSRQVLLLEEELGEPLFLRLGRKVRLTHAGESLLQLSRRVLADIRPAQCLLVIDDRRRRVARSPGPLPHIHRAGAQPFQQERRPTRRHGCIASSSSSRITVEILKALVLIGMGITIIPYRP